MNYEAKKNTEDVDRENVNKSKNKQEAKQKEEDVDKFRENANTVVPGKYCFMLWNVFSIPKAT
jgi:hypothetical protein